MQLFEREREILADLSDLADIKEGNARIEALLADLIRKVDKMSELQTDYDNDIAALATFLNTTLPQALTQIQQELANQGITSLSSLDQLVNTSLPAVQGTLTGVGQAQAPVAQATPAGGVTPASPAAS